MSRYANRGLAAPNSSSRARTPQPRSRFGEDDERNGFPNSSYGPDDGYDDGDDDTTAVATDLSGLKPPAHERRGVAFGANEIETFHGSEAPDAVQPAPSTTRHLGERMPGIGRPRSVSIDGRRRDDPVLPPPPPQPRYLVSDQRIRDGTPERELSLNGGRPSLNRRSMISPAPMYDEREDDFHRRPPLEQPSWRGGQDRPQYDDEFATGRGRDDMLDDEDEYDDDGDTAVGTGVASELSSSFDRHALQNRQPVLPSREPPSSFLAIPRPPSRGVQVRRSMLPPPPPAPRQYYYTDPVRFAGPPRSGSQSGYDSSDLEYPEAEPPAGVLLRQQQQQQQYSRHGYPDPPSSGLWKGISRPVSSASTRMQVDEAPAPVEPYVRSPVARPEVPEDSPLEKELIELLKQLKFSVALKDFHDAMKIGVQKTLVAEDGKGHAYCKVHCKRLPKQEDIAREPHLRNHWIPLTGSHWQFRTASHSVTVVFKTAALAAYEAQFLTARR